MPNCKCCRKKTHLEFKCTCGGIYCVACRIPEVHKCTIALDQIPKINLEKVVAPKIEKI